MSAAASAPDLAAASRRDRRRLLIVAGILTAACLWLSLSLLEPIPPRTVTIASGPAYSLFHRHAQAYREALAREGVTVVERPTEGAGENMDLLADPASGVDVAFVQGGQARHAGADQVVMLASLHYQPLWILMRRGEGVDSLSQLAGRRVSLGMPGSGSNVLAEPLLAANGVDAGNSALMHLPSIEARDALKSRSIDAAIVVGGVRTPFVHEALVDPVLEAVGLAHADAYAQRYPYLTRRTLHAGAIAFAPPVPSRDVPLVATEAMLAARDTLHPAIVNLLLEVIRDAHDDQGYFEDPGEFPNVTQVDLRVSSDALRHSRFGPSLLYRYLPFWVAAFVERFIVIVLPLLLVVLPVLRYLPQVIAWRVRSRIHRWYGELALLEREVQSGADAPPVGRWLSDLDRIERAASRVAAPASFASEVYTLREHIDLVRREVRARARGTT